MLCCVLCLCGCVLHAHLRKINLFAWLMVLAPLTVYLLSVGMRNFYAIVFNPIVPRSWRLKAA